MHKIIDAPGVAEAAIGKVLPYAFGPLPHAPAIAVRTGAQASLREAMTATVPPTGGSIKLNAVDALRRFPATGTVQIEGERCTYAGRDETAPPGGIALTGITRAAEGSVAAIHALGTPVNQVVAQHVYVICENPGAHRVAGVNAVYLNGILKEAEVPPTHVVNLDDTGVLFDDETGSPISVVSITFDLSTITAAQSEYIIPSTLAALQQWLNTHGAHSISGGSGGTATTSTPDVANPLSQIETYMRGGRVPMRPKIFPVPQLGLVEVDLDGLKDDSLGTITGTPNAFMTRPAHITRCLLREAFQQRQQGAAFDLASWAAAATTQGFYNLAWALLFYPVDYPTFQRLVSIQSRTDVFRDPGGAGWRAVFRRRVAPTYTSTATRRIAWEYRTTQAQAVVTTLTVRYGEGTQQGVLPLDSPTALARYPALSEEVLMPWVPSAAIAETLGRHQLALRDHVRREATLTEAWPAVAVTRTDAIGLSIPSIDVYGDLPWRVRGFRIRPDGTITLDTEEEALGFEEWFKPSDALALVLAEVVRFAIAPKPSDTLAVQISETAIIALPSLIAAADAPAVQISEVASIAVPTLIAASDAPAVRISETASIAIAFAAADAPAVRASEAASILVPTLVSAADALPVAIASSPSITEPAAIAIDASSAKQCAVAASDTLSHTCSGTDRYLVVALTVDRASTVSSITYNGVAMSLLGSVTTSSRLTALYGLVNPDTGAHTVAVTLNQASRWTISAISFTGVHQTTPVGTAVTDDLTTVTHDAWVGVGSEDDELLVGIVHAGYAADPGTITAGEFSTIHQSTQNNGAAGWAQLVTAPGKVSTSLGVKHTTARASQAVGIALKPASEGSTGDGPVPNVTGTPTSGTTGAGAAAASLTWSHTIAGGLSNSVLVVGVVLRSASSETVASVTWNGTGLTQVATVRPTGGPRVDLWMLASPASGTANIVVTPSANQTMLGCAVTLEDAAATTRDSDTASGTAAGRLATPVVSSADTDLLVVMTGFLNTGAQEMGEGQTSQKEETTTGGSTTRGILATQPGNAAGVVGSQTVTAAGGIVAVSFTAP